MTYADTMVVMEKFMSRFDNLERVLSEMSAKKNMTMTGDTREFLTIVKHVVGCIGEDYIAGLVCQKAYE